MLLSSSTTERLDAFLAGMPIEALNALVREIERARLRGSADEVGGLIIQRARSLAQRRKLRLARFPTPKRLFATPLEPFLVDARIDRKQPGRIARTSLAPIWQWLMRDLLPDQGPHLVDRAVKALLADEIDTAKSIIGELQAAAVDAIGPVMRDVDSQAWMHMRLSAHVGGEQVLEDARDMAVVLKNAAKLKRFARSLPKLIVELCEEEFDWLRMQIAELAADDPALTTHALAILMSRLRQPAQILRLAVYVAGTDEAEVVATSAYGAAVDLVLHDISAMAHGVDEALTGASNYSAVQLALSRYYKLAHEMRLALEMSGADRPSKRLSLIRAELSAALEARMAPAPRLIRANLAPRNSEETFPPPDDMEVEAAELAINLLQDARIYMSELALNDLVARLGHDVTAFLNYTADSLITRLRSVKPDERDAARCVLAAAVRLTRAALGDEMADLLEHGGARAMQYAEFPRQAKAS